MEKDKGVRIVEECKIFPFSQSQSEISLPLAAFDRLPMRTPPLQRLLFYAIDGTPNHNASNNSFFDSIIPKLKHSLSLTLSHFLPLAGNLRWPEDSPLPFILYSPGDAVSFTVAVADADSDFHHVCGNHPREVKHSLPFAPTTQSSDSAAPIMAVKVTHFPNDGFCIGFAVHHVIFDGYSFNLFLKSWAHVCKLVKTGETQLDECPNLPPELTPSFERPPNVLQNPFNFSTTNRSVKYNEKIWSPSSWLQVTLELTPTDIQKLKNKVLEEVGKEEGEELHLSTFVVVYAYAFMCLLKSKQEECKELVHLGFAADVRGLLDPPVSSNYFGNCVILGGTMVEARELREGEDWFTNIVKKISHPILEMRRSGPVQVSMVADIIEVYTKYHSRAEFCMVISSPKFKLYETDFGWGNPNKVEVVSLSNNYICLMDSKNGGPAGGVQISLVLPDRHQLDIFTSLFAHGLN